MERQKLIIADSSEEYGRALADSLRGSYQIRICREGRDALQTVRTFLPDILVLDLMLPGLDGISLMQMTAAAGLRPMVLATTRYVSDYILESVERLGVGYLMVKPCDVGATAARIADLSQRLKAPVFCPREPGTLVSDLLQTLGVPAKLRGYGYLRQAVLLMSRNRTQSITKELYPAAAAVCGGSATQIERSIRGAIAAAWERRDEQVWRMYFPAGEGGQVLRPSNGDFICRLAEVLLNLQEHPEE